MLSRYALGRALAAERDAMLDYHGTPEGEVCAHRIKDITRDIDAAGGWDDDAQRGYDDARSDYAKERTP